MPWSRYDSDEELYFDYQDFKRQRKAEKRGHNELLAYPDPQDPDHPITIYDDDYQGEENE